MSLAQVNLMHIVLIGPTLILLGTENELINKYKNIFKHFVLLFSIMIFFIVRIDWIYKILFYKNKLTRRNWINLIHHIVIPPLFYYLYKNHTYTYIKKILQKLGIIIIITHFILFVIKNI